MLVDEWALLPMCKPGSRRVRSSSLPRASSALFLLRLRLRNLFLRAARAGNAELLDAIRLNVFLALKPREPPVVVKEPFRLAVLL